jgi:nicotinamidase-related amidase
MATGLILVDIQNEYFPGGRMELAGVDKAAANASEHAVRRTARKCPPLARRARHPEALPQQLFFSAG